MSEWEWELTETAERDFADLEDYAQDRVASKLDDIVTDQWRDPSAYVEPLQGVPHGKLRVGPFRLGCRLDQSQQVLYVLRIKKRGGDAYRSDDDD